MRSLALATTALLIVAATFVLIPDPGLRLGVTFGIAAVVNVVALLWISTRYEGSATFQREAFGRHSGTGRPGRATRLRR